MTRIPVGTSIPEELKELFEAATNGRQPPLNLHSQMATSPVVLSGCVGIRRALEEHSTFEHRMRFALMLAVSAIDSCTYTQAVNTVLADRVGFGEDEVAAILAGSTIGEQPIDALLGIAREAAAGDGRVSAETWPAAIDAGGSHPQLAEAYASIALAVFVERYVSHAVRRAGPRNAGRLRGEVTMSSLCPRRLPQVMKRRPMFSSPEKAVAGDREGAAGLWQINKELCHHSSHSAITRVGRHDA